MLKNDIISLLRQNPQGLMAKEIAQKLGIDKTSVNSTL